MENERVITVRLPAWQHDLAKLSAQRQALSLNKFCLEAIDYAIHLQLTEQEIAERKPKKKEEAA